MTKIFINDEEFNLHDTVGWLNYDRVVMLSGLRQDRDYAVTVHGRDLEGGVIPLDGHRFVVTPLLDPWYVQLGRIAKRLLWPS